MFTSKVKLILLFVYLILNTIIVTSTFGQNHVNKPIEINLTSAKIYRNPIVDVTIRCTFKHQITGKQIIVLGYWDGGLKYKIRFSAPIAGYWLWNVDCSDTTNATLHLVKGDVYVTEYSGSNVLYSKGKVKVSDSGNHLMFPDGTPFFYLSDSAWEIVNRSTKDSAYYYITERAKQGFSAINFVASSHIYFVPEKCITNLYNQSYFLDSNYMIVNPRYFDYVDSLIVKMNENGIIAVFCPLWGCNEFYRPYGCDHFISTKGAYALAKYVGARYNAHKVIWIVAGDGVYDTPQLQNHWTEYANQLRLADGNQNVVTCHTAGWTCSEDYFPNSTQWLDFHMYQSSHGYDFDYTFKKPLSYLAKNRTPVKPLLNAEAVYEDIYNRLWTPKDSTRPMPIRINSTHVRMATYESVLSGAVCGIAYGVNGIWQWNEGGKHSFYEPRYMLKESIQLEGSKQVCIFKNFMIGMNWYKFTPAQDLLRETHIENTVKRFVPIAKQDSMILMYLPPNTTSVLVNVDSISLNRRLSVRWLNPRTGEKEKWVLLNFHQVSLNVVPPDTNDWLFQISTSDSDTHSGDTVGKYHNILNVRYYANKLRFTLPEVEYKDVVCELFNIKGECVVKPTIIPYSSQEYVLQIETTLPNGLYCFQIQTTFTQGKSHFYSGVFLKHSD